MGTSAVMGADGGCNAWNEFDLALARVPANNDHIV